LGGIDQRSAFSPDAYETGLAQPVKVESQRIWRNAERLGDFACCHSRRTGLHKQPEYIETVILCERSESRDGLRFFHTSTNIEVSQHCQDPVKASNDGSPQLLV
jgi:hypothetical protein